MLTNKSGLVYRTNGEHLSLVSQVERKVDENDKLYQTMPKSLPSMSCHLNLNNESSSVQSNSDTATTSPESPNTSTTNDSFDSTPTHSISSSSGTDTPNFQSTPTRNGTLRRSDCYDSLEKKSQNDKLVSGDDPWLEKGINRSMSGPDCLQRHANDSDTDSVSSLQFRDDNDNMSMSTDSGLEVISAEPTIVQLEFIGSNN